MTLDELTKELNELGIPPKWLSVNGPDSFGANVIHYEYNNMWRVYHIVDYGTLVYDEWFGNFEDALAYTYQQALKAAPHYSR